MKYTNGQAFVWILTFLVAKFVWLNYSFVLPALYFTAPVILHPWSDLWEIICTVFCRLWLLPQIGQRHHLSCIISYMCFVSCQSCQRYDLKCILSYTFYPQWIRKITCSIFCYMCMLHQTGQRHHLSCILSYLHFCLTPAGSETLPAVHRGQPGLHGVHSAGQHLPGPPGGHTPACAKWRAADQDDGWLPVPYTSQTTCTALSRSHEKRWW